MHSNTSNNYHQKIKHQEKSKTTKLSFLTVMIFSVGSCIGAGIFFKNQSILDNTGHNVVLMYLSWAIAIVGVMMIGLTLKELTSKAQKYGSEGYLGWVRFFCGEKFHRGCRNFLIYIYLTTNFFFLPYYAVLALQDAVGAILWNGHDAMSSFPQMPVYGTIIIAFVIMIYFTWTSSISVKYASIQSNIVTFMKFIPLAFASIGGIVLFSVNGGAHPLLHTLEGPKQHFSTLNPGLGVLASIPAIFFAFDGFYTTSASFDKMKDPSKGSLAISIGLVTVSTIYILVSIGIYLATKDAGDYAGTIIGFIMMYGGATWWRTIVFIVLLFIVFAVFGIINGFGLYGSEVFKEEIEEGVLPFSSYMKKKFNWEKSRLGVTIYTVSIYTIVFILFTAISFAYTGASYAEGYGEYSGRIYAMSDLTSNWTSLFAFMFITTAIAGALHKKIKEHTAWSKNGWKFTIPAIIACSLVSLAFLYVSVETFYNTVVEIENTFAGDGSQVKDTLIPSLLTSAIYIVFMFVGYVEPFIGKRNKK